MNWIGAERRALPLPDGPHEAGTADALIIRQQRHVQTHRGCRNQPVKGIGQAGKPARLPDAVPNQRLDHQPRPRGNEIVPRVEVESRTHTAARDG